MTPIEESGVSSQLERFFQENLPDMCVECDLEEATTTCNICANGLCVDCYIENDGVCWICIEHRVEDEDA